MKSSIILFLTFILISCVRNNNNLPCSDFNIKVVGGSIDNNLFLSKLSKNLKNKLQLLKNNNSKNICEIIINFNSNTYSTIIDESGYTGRKNFKLDLNYSINVKNKKILNRNNIVLFYGANISDNYYSEYVYGQKRKDNDLNILTEKLFYYIAEDLRKIK